MLEYDAVLLAYGIFQPHNTIQVVVFRQGGQTTECCVLRVGKTLTKLQGHAVNESLGGSKIDDLLVNYAFIKLREKNRSFRNDEKQVKFELRELCKHAKHELSSND